MKVLSTPYTLVRRAFSFAEINILILFNDNYIESGAARDFQSNLGIVLSWLEFRDNSKTRLLYTVYKTI